MRGCVAKRGIPIVGYFPLVEVSFWLECRAATCVKLVDNSMRLGSVTITSSCLYPWACRSSESCSVLAMEFLSRNWSSHRHASFVFTVLLLRLLNSVCWRNPHWSDQSSVLPFFQYKILSETNVRMRTKYVLRHLYEILPDCTDSGLLFPDGPAIRLLSPFVRLKAL